MTAIDFIFAVAVLVAGHACVKILACLTKLIKRSYNAIMQQISRYFVHCELSELSNECQKLKEKLVVANRNVAILTRQNCQLKLIVHELMQAGEALGRRSQQDFGRSAGREAS